MRHIEYTVIDGRKYLIINHTAFYPMDCYTPEEALADYNTQLLENMYENF